VFAASHRRLNRLTGEWVLVSPQRTARPWQGQVEEVPTAQQPAYDPACYLCPGNERAGGARNPRYGSTHVFDNDFAALTPDVVPEEDDRKGLLVAQSERGISRVVCFSPRHARRWGRCRSRRSARWSTPGSTSTSSSAASTGSVTCRSSRTAAP
jgi:UDPglucose--hexose-1-phosphate uridylyltransferase